MSIQIPLGIVSYYYQQICVTFDHQNRHVVYRNFGFELSSHDPSDHKRIRNDDYYLAFSLSLSLSADEMMVVCNMKWAAFVRLSVDTDS